MYLFCTFHEHHVIVFEEDNVATWCINNIQKNITNNSVFVILTDIKFLKCDCQLPFCLVALLWLLLLQSLYFNSYQLSFCQDINYAINYSSDKFSVWKTYKNKVMVGQKRIKYVKARNFTLWHAEFISELNNCSFYGVRKKFIGVMN